MEEFRKSFLRLVWATVGLYAVVAVVIVIGYLDSRSKLNSLNDEIHNRCLVTEGIKKIVRDDELTQLHRSLSYLKQHPQGIPGIPRELILQAIEDNRVAVRKLHAAACK